jgi:hypothetical protein
MLRCLLPGVGLCLLKTPRRLAAEPRRGEWVYLASVCMANRISLDEQSVRQGRERWVKACREVSSVLLVVIELSIDCLFDCPLF